MNARTRRTVVVGLRGGLGNQMFQYALGRALSERHGRRLVIDCHQLALDRPGVTARRYGLHVFRTRARLAAYRGNGVDVLAVLSEVRPPFLPDVLADLPFDHILLNGFWQSERYFADIAAMLRREFRFQPGPWMRSRWERAIRRASTPICLHVRRQDYLTSVAGRRLGFLGKAYYDRAIANVARRVADPHFFVFSDDIAWCRKHLTLSGAHTFIDSAGARSKAQAVRRAVEHDAADFRLMTLCRHYIIANSSFSWWAAWLGERADTIVIAPKRWYRQSARDSRSVVPARWVRV